jgi:sugar phosphate permease
LKDLFMGPNSSDQPTRVRYGVVGLATLMAVVLYLDRICLSITEIYITRDLNLSDWEASLLVSAFFWTYALGQVPSGWFSDRFGARGVLALYILGWSVFTGLMGVANSFLAVFAYRLGCGLAQAGAYPTSAALLSRWVPLSARARASGIVATGGRIGGVIAPALTAYLMVRLATGDTGAQNPNWRAVMLLYGIAGIVVAALFWLGVRERPAEHPACNQAEVALVESGLPSSAARGRAQGLPLTAILRSRSLWLSSLNQFGTNFGWVFVITWLPRYLTEAHQVPIEERGVMSSLPLLIGIAGMLAGGWLTDRLTKAVGLRWGRALPMAVTRFVSAAAFASCVLLDSPWEVIAALCVMTVTTDLGVPAVWAFMQDVGGRHVGSVLGWGNMWGNLGAAVSPVVLRWVVANGGWDACFLACAAAFVISGASALGIDATVPVTPVPKEEAS